MVETIIYSLLMLLCFLISSHVILKAYTKGLQHNYELKNNIIPKENSSPIVQVIEKYQEKQQAKEEKSILDEYLNG